MDKTTLIIMFLSGIVLLVFYKFIIIDSYIYKELRQKHSKTYLKKHCTMADKIFYRSFKNEISKVNYFLNVLFVAMTVLNVIFIFVSLFNSELFIVKIYLYVFLAVVCFSFQIEIFKATWSVVKTKNILIRAFIAVVFGAVFVALVLEFLNII